MFKVGRATYQACLKTYLLPSSRRPYDPCLGGFINLQETFTYLVALKTCVERRGVKIGDDAAYIMFTSSVYRFYAFTFMLMQNHNGVKRQC